MKILAIFPGRYHPFHKGHAASFKQLAQKFGLKNTFLAISAKQEQPDSPFSAKDRARMAEALGVPTKNIIAVTSPYSAKEYSAIFEPMGYDPEHTALVFAVSQKDMITEGTDDPRFSFKPKKDGTPSYFQPWTGKTPISPMSKHGYVISTDVAEFPIAGKSNVKDASTIRRAYAGANTRKKIKILTDLYGENAVEKMKPIFDNNLLVISENIKAVVKKIKPLLSEATIEQKTRFVELLSEAKELLQENTSGD